MREGVVGLVEVDRGAEQVGGLVEEDTVAGVAVQLDTAIQRCSKTHK